ncbi:hypothetical protein EYY60_01085 [Flavobacterium zhairuonense]|nr:hypothetical protein [Flavobacterium zhairuonense]KAF2516800.1 hypothetical protein EYY60_01085 [Flavobacterium zhairuonense]
MSSNQLRIITLIYADLSQSGIFNIYKNSENPDGRIVAQQLENIRNAV